MLPPRPPIAPSPKQIGQRWSPPSAQELIRAVLALRSSGKLLKLVQPGLTISRAGRSKNLDNANAEEVGRVKDFIDELHAVGPAVAAMNYTLSGNITALITHRHTHISNRTHMIS